MTRTVQLVVFNSLQSLNPPEQAENWIGVKDNVLCVKARDISNQSTAGFVSPADIPISRFEKYRLPPEMEGRWNLPFLARVTFSETGVIEGLMFAVLEASSGQGEVPFMWMAGTGSLLRRDPEEALLTTSELPSLEKCAVTYPVVLLQDDRKAFDLGGGWHSLDIPAHDDFRAKEWLARQPGVVERWDRILMNVRVKRKGFTRDVIGTITSTGGNGAFSIFSVPGFAKLDDNVRSLDADQFNPGDSVRIVFGWFGKEYPAVERFKTHHKSVGLIPPASPLEEAAEIVRTGVHDIATAIIRNPPD